MQGCGARITNFILQQFQENYLAKKRVLFLAFIDLEKASEQVPSVVVL